MHRDLTISHAVFALACLVCLLITAVVSIVLAEQSYHETVDQRLLWLETEVRTDRDATMDLVHGKDTVVR